MGRAVKSPFFSVVIPTKGRSFLVGGAIASVLRQSFPDFEVVVADNDDSDATARVVNEFKDPRLRHHRTGGLSMPDNWEAACAQARGEFLLILEDKQALRGHALAEIHGWIEKHRASCLRWKYDALNDTAWVTWMERPCDVGTARFLPSEEVLRIFVSGPMSATATYLPIGHLSAFSRELTQKIRNGPSRRLCPPVSPDFALGLQAMHFGDGVLFVEAPLVAVSLRHSNGRSLGQKAALGRQFMNEIGGPNRLWSRTPIQAPIIPASLYNDFLELQTVLGGKLAAFPLDWVNYYVETWRFLIHQDKEGIPVQDEFAAFRAALLRESAPFQQVVWAAISERVGVPRRNLFMNRIKSLRRRTGLLAIEDNWRLLLRWLTGRRHVGKFKTPLDFVVWADQAQSGAVAGSHR